MLINNSIVHSSVKLVIKIQPFHVVKYITKIWTNFKTLKVTQKKNPTLE